MSDFKSLKNLVEFTYNSQKFTWGDGKNFVLFAGPDIVEDQGMVLEVAQELKKITSELKIPWILKCSFDKANRQSGDKFRGHGMKEGLKVLNEIKKKVDVPLLTDVHETIQMEAVAEVADVIQIPAFLSRQTDLIISAAQTGKVLHIKKGQFLAPWDMKSVAQKAVQAGNSKLLLCERGTSFGYNRLVNDMTGLIEMRNLGFPVIMDCTHSTQLPGAQGDSSGGRREMSLALARAALAIGVDGLFFETHPNPDEALCDGPTSIPLNKMKAILSSCQKVFATHGF